MIMQLLFLGTACMQPTKERGHPAVLLVYNGEGILFDCGENTQRQLKIAGVTPSKINKILVSHWHGDHVLGIPGLIQTMGSSEYNQKLQLFGPKDTKTYMGHMMAAFFSKSSIDFEVNEINKRIFYENEDFKLEALELTHGIPTLGYSFIEKDKRNINLSYVRSLGIPDGPLLGKLQNGKQIEWKGKQILPDDATILKKGRKVTYICDTSMCNNAVELAKDADILICESSYESKLKNKAEEYMHLTAKEAAEIATMANVKKLILTHFSARYKTVSDIEEEAKAIFPETRCAFDFMKVKL